MKSDRNKYIIAWNKKWRDSHREECRTYNREYARKLRRGVIEYYGGKCACCGEKTYDFLTIDHINGGGRKHRKEVKNQGIAPWLKRNGFPRGFQVLCYNCNNAKSTCGVCPHQSSIGL